MMFQIKINYFFIFFKKSFSFFFWNISITEMWSHVINFHRFRVIAPPTLLSLIRQVKSSATTWRFTRSAIEKRDRERNSQRAEREIIDPRRWISGTETAEVEASSLEIARSSGTTEAFMVPCVAVPALRAGNWITVPRYQLRKTSVHALTTSHVLTYDGRGVNGYATGSRWIWVAALNPHHRFCSVPA